MALSELEVKRCEQALDAFMVKRRPPVHIRNELDLGYRIENQSVEIFEIRPRRGSPSEKVHIPIAKATYIKTQKRWKVYWQRGDMKWHSYELLPTADTLQEFLGAVDEDECACFFG